MEIREQEVLQVFQRVSPSLTPADTDEQFDSLVQRRTNALLKLKLPPILFHGKRLIDLGCGTGETAAVYAHYGANVSGVEFNPLAVSRMVELFSKQGLTDRLGTIWSEPISSWNPPKESFDIGVSLGVIHHLPVPREGVAKLASSIRPGGIMLISTGGKPGDEQRQIMRKAIRRFSDNLVDAVELSEKLFPEYMYRATTFGCRTPEQVVNDNFLVPQNVSIGLDELVQWFSDEGFVFYRILPNIEPQTAESATSVVVDWFSSEYRSILMDKARLWAICKDGGVRDTSWSEAQLARAFEELKHVSDMVDNGDIAGLESYLPSCEWFGRGYCGVGDYHVVGLKK